MLANLLLLQLLPGPDAVKEWTTGKAPRGITVLQALERAIITKGKWRSGAP